jgi:hypothetical protein
MSNRTKMYDTNSKARKWLVENGFTEIHFFPHTRFSKDAYFKGLGWDGLATYGHRLALFQTKTNCACTKKVQEQMRIAAGESGVILIWINKIKRKGLDVFTICSPAIL